MPARNAPQPLQERDFLAYERHRQDDPEYNALRLAVRRKLKGWVDAVGKEAKALGVTLSAQGGLHHPYTFNNYRVREQRAYLCRSPAERRKLASFFGEALGKDAETHYIQTVLEVSLDDKVVEAALRIHPMAWWDGEHVKKRVLGTTSDGVSHMEEWVAMLKALPPGFDLRLHDWRKEYPCARASAQEMREYFTTYTPGEHWLHIVRTLPRDEALAMGTDAPTWAVQSLLALLPVYRFCLWTP